MSSTFKENDGGIARVLLTSNEINNSGNITPIGHGKKSIIPPTEANTTAPSEAFIIRTTLENLGKKNSSRDNFPLSPKSQRPLSSASAMHWSKSDTHGTKPGPLRAHTLTLVGDQFFLFGGCDNKGCYNAVYIFDPDTMFWFKPKTTGDAPPSTRAHTTVTIDKKLFVFGGGDGPVYYNHLYIFDTERFHWIKPTLQGEPPVPRRAHTAWVYDNKMFVFGGGDGVRALNDVIYIGSDLNSMGWSTLKTSGEPPTPRGYHTTNVIGHKAIIMGGSDGHECFSDIFILDLEKCCWFKVDIDRGFSRLSHTATQVGSYLFVCGGHDGAKYAKDVVLLNLVTMTWQTRKVYGTLPWRGYHTCILYDSRLFVHGGSDGREVFDEVWILDLGAAGYLPMITNFSVGEAI